MQQHPIVRIKKASYVRLSEQENAQLKLNIPKDTDNGCF